MVTLDQGQWPQVMSTKGNAPGKWHLAQSSLTYIPPQKAASEKLCFFLGWVYLLQSIVVGVKHNFLLSQIVANSLNNIT